MEKSANGDLRFRTLDGRFVLHVILCGSGTPFTLRYINHPPRIAQPPPAIAQPPPRNELPARRGQHQRGDEDDTSSSSSSTEDNAPQINRYRKRRKQQIALEEIREEESSPEVEYQNFSQLTGRRRRV